jgi:small subunit ribosomal protein S6
MTKDYELMVILSPRLNADEANSLNDGLMAQIVENGGEVIKTDAWGKRMLAYPINKVQEAYYFVNYFKLDSQVVKTLKRLYNINENILRHMFVARGE